MKKASQKHVFIVMGIISVVVFALFYQTYACLPAPAQAPRTSTHGYEIWSNELFKSFSPGEKRFCVPKGWQPVGESTLERGGARFPEGSTGILIRSSDFSFIDIPVEKKDFELRAVYLARMPESERDRYVETITRAFNAIGSLYPAASSTQRHTVLISVGIAGDGHEFEESIYPNPSQYLTVFAKNKDHERAEELFIHAAAHAYNRFHPDFQSYQANQHPLPVSDFQEMEATWMEIAFRNSPTKLSERIDNLFTTYEALMDDSYSPEILFPLNVKSVFDDVSHKTVLLPETATHGDHEFGHYVLAPLVMLSIQGMLAENNASTTVNTFLQQVHRTNENFFTLLTSHLQEGQIEDVFRFIKGEERIPRNLIESGASTL